MGFTESLYCPLCRSCETQHGYVNVWFRYALLLGIESEFVNRHSPEGRKVSNSRDYFTAYLHIYHLAGFKSVFDTVFLQREG